MGPTELRILLAAGTLRTRLASMAFFGGRYLLFDVGGVVAIAAPPRDVRRVGDLEHAASYQREPLPKATEMSETA